MTRIIQNYTYIVNKNKYSFMYITWLWLLGSCTNLGGGGLGGGFFFTGCWKPFRDFDCFNESTFANLDFAL